MAAGVSTRVGELNPPENKGEEIVLGFVKVCETFCDVSTMLWVMWSISWGEGSHERGSIGEISNLFIGLIFQSIKFLK